MLFFFMLFVSSCRVWHLLEYEGAQHPGDSLRASGPGQHGRVRDTPLLPESFLLSLPEGIPGGTVPLSKSAPCTTQILKICAEGKLFYRDSREKNK